MNSFFGYPGTNSFFGHPVIRLRDMPPTEDGWHALSFLKSAGRFSRHSNLNALIRQGLSSTHIPSVLESRHLYRNNHMRQNVCQSVISGSLTLRDTKIRDFGVKFLISKFRMEPVMLSFLAPTENTKIKEPERPIYNRGKTLE